MINQQSVFGRVTGLLLTLLFGFIMLSGCDKPASGLVDLSQPIQVSLVAHEALGGHTIERHVAKTDEYLIDRLLTDSRLNTVSTFSNLAVAEASVNAVLNLQREQVARWWQGELARQAFFARVPTHGTYLTRAQLHNNPDAKPQWIPDQAVVRVVLVRRGDDFFVLTAFPQPD
jgi:hypothetical protein